MGLVCSTCYKCQMDASEVQNKRKYYYTIKYPDSQNNI